MSSINSTQSGLGLSQFLQSLTSNSASSASNGSSGSTTSTLSSLLQQVGHHRHHGGGGGFEKLADAVTNALQAASNGSSGSTATDANQTITQALTKIFQNGSLGSTSDSDNDDSTGSAPASNNATPGAATTNATAGLPDAFVQTLKSFGVTPQQFQTDLTAALKTAQDSGSVDVSSVFKNFPIGSVVDSIG